MLYAEHLILNIELNIKGEILFLHYHAVLQIIGGNTSMTDP